MLVGTILLVTQGSSAGPSDTVVGFVSWGGFCASILVMEPRLVRDGIQVFGHNFDCMALRRSGLSSTGKELTWLAFRNRIELFGASSLESSTAESARALLGFTFGPYDRTLTATEALKSA